MSPFEIIVRRHASLNDFFPSFLNALELSLLFLHSQAVLYLPDIGFHLFCRLHRVHVGIVDLV